MTIITTRLGSEESARRTRFEPTGTIAATNVQKAIEEAASEAQAVDAPAVEAPADAAPVAPEPPPPPSGDAAATVTVFVYAMAADGAPFPYDAAVLAAPITSVARCGTVPQLVKIQDADGLIAWVHQDDAPGDIAALPQQCELWGGL